jgi:CBS domain-containing membrane protein
MGAAGHRPARRRGLELLEPTLIRALAQRLRLTNLLQRFSERWVWSAFMLINGFLSIFLLAALAALTNSPFVFPSLGPTAFLFFYSPTSPTASPRHCIYGHAIGIACGYVSLLITGLQDAPAAVVAGVGLGRMVAAGLSLSLTGALMIVLRAAHPPAGATTLIISLGIITKPLHLVLIEVAVGLLVLQAIVINKLAGLDYPWWARRKE